MRICMHVLFIAVIVLLHGYSPAAETSKIKVDLPVSVPKADMVFNLDHAAFAGDMPVGIKYMTLLNKRMKEAGTKARIVGVFHGQAAYMVLNDRAYNANRHVSTGNPYKNFISDLLKQGVQIEECAVSMETNEWSNSDLLPGVKVTSGAVLRITQLVQQGFVQIQP